MKTSTRFSFQTISVVGLTLLAQVLGGATELWAQAIIVLLAAGLILLAPPRVALDSVPLLIAGGFLLLAFSAFLPVKLGINPEWRRHLTQDLHAPLGIFRTPQPWITLQSCSLLLFGIVWSCYLLAQEWSPAEKSQTLRLLAMGVIVLAGISVACYVTGYRIPGWNQEQNRGWFPNRNQTADVLALAGVVTYAIAFKRLQKKEWTGLLWLAGLALIFAALIVSFSRAGIVIFFAGIAFWHVAALVRPNEGKSFAVGLAFLLLLLSFFLLFGGNTLERFLPAPETDRLHADDYRILLQEDALRVSLQAPILGWGLGNFEPVFNSMRLVSIDQNRALHPESDWLWIMVEMGWIAPVLILAAVRWWLTQCLPFALRSGEALRSVAVVAFILFILHGFVDVSGHRIGSMMVGVLLGSIALSPAVRRTTHPRIPTLYRGLSLVLFAMGTWWMVSVCADVGPPTTATLARIQNRLNLAAADGRMASVSEAANAALKLAPLDWTFYFRRASAEAFRNGAREQAANDFQIARSLEPTWIDLCYSEGQIWLAVDDPAHPDPTLCLDAWRETLKRAGRKGAPLYTAMLEATQDHPDIRHGLKDFAVMNADYLVIFLNYASPEEVKSAIGNLLSRDPDLATLHVEQQHKLFAAWYAHGDQDALARLLTTHSDWQVSGWPYLAQYFASTEDFQMASMTSMRYLTPPVLPPLSADQTLPVLRGSFAQHPDNLAEGVMLCQAQTQANQLDDALATLGQLEKLKDCPRYIYYLKAQIYVKQQEWEEAWNALQQLEQT